jgi:hypothetical protein
MASRRIEVCLEVTPKQAFASALEWPGWCRAGRDEGAALEVLARYAGRYAPVAAHAGVSFPATVAFDVAERVPGGPATAFAAPECRRPFPQTTAAADRATVTPAAARRLAGLLAAVWATFDDIAAASQHAPLTGSGRSIPHECWQRLNFPGTDLTSTNSPTVTTAAAVTAEPFTR